jgi:hypothetical protein
MKPVHIRWRFATRWALRHALLSVVVALISAILVFELWYPMPYRALLRVGGIFLLVLVVDVVCGPLMTLVLASPRKSKREMTLDLGLIALIQTAALAYGMHAVWTARPAVLAFETDRLTVISANEIDHDALDSAPDALHTLPLSGVLHVGTRKPQNNAELLRSIDLSLAGLSPAMRPAWWVPMAAQHDEMRARAKPLAALMAQRPEDSAVLAKAASTAGYPVETLTYLPLTSSKTREWVALLDSSLKMVGYAPVDGF